MSETGSSEWAPPADSQPEVNFPREQKPQLIEVPDWAKANNPETVEKSETVIDDPFSNGNEIIVERSPNKKTGAPAYLEAGWKIIDDQAMVETERGSGKWMAAVRVEKEIDGVPYHKVISLEKVYAFNPREVASTPEIAEKEPLSEAQEDVAEVAIEVAAGIEDPSEIDEHAHNFDVAEIRAMREAAAAANRATGVEASASAERKEKNPHLARLFEPPVRPELPPSKINLMDAMLSKEEGVYEAAQAQKAAEDKANEPLRKKQQDYDRITNQDTREYSEQQLIAAMRRDGTLRELLAEKGFTEASIDAVDAIREDAELRYEIGEHLLTKLNRMIDEDKVNRGNNFGPRLMTNGEKSNDYLALPVRTSSREYAAYLALAKISGMFNYKVDSSDVFQDQDDKGTIIMNQHRHAADMLL